MRVQATNAIRYNGKVLRAGSVFEMDMKTGERLFQRGHVKPTSAPVQEVAVKPSPTESLLKELGNPTAGQPRGKKTR